MTRPLHDLHPDDGRALVDKAGPQRRYDYDLTFSAPKCAPIVWAAADWELREAIATAMPVAGSADPLPRPRPAHEPGATAGRVMGGHWSHLPGRARCRSSSACFRTRQRARHTLSAHGGMADSPASIVGRRASRIEAPPAQGCFVAESAATTLVSQPEPSWRARTRRSLCGSGRLI
jgi:hypothetical protein